MSAWWPKYKPVKNPVEDPRGWKWPFQGDPWPVKDGWYWVWEDGRSRMLDAVTAYWSSKEQRFFARPDVVAWRKAEREKREGT